MHRTLWQRRAVTLLELLVTLAATVVLAAILVLTLRGVRGQTLVALNLNNLRMSIQDIHAWGLENDSKMLNIESPTSALFTRTHRDLPNPPAPLFESLYWGQVINWAEYLAAHHGRRAAHWTTAFREPTATGAGIPPQAGRVVEPTFLYSPTMFTASSLWTDPPPSASIAQAARYFRAVRASDITHPGGKGVLIQRAIPAADATHHIAFADGHAATHHASALSKPTPNPTSPVGAPGVPVLHTLNGHEGVDR